MKERIEAHGLPVAAALLAGVVAATVVQVSSRPPPPTIEVRPMQPQPTPTALIYVHVEGAVNAPGVYSLPSGARIFDAIDVAGGPTEDADTSMLNLAAKAADGQKLVVPARAAGSPPEPVAAPGALTPAAGPARPSPRINVNTASQRVLETLPGIGPVTAQRIIEYRQSNGPFARIEQLRDARIVNASTFERIKDLISVE